MFTEDLDTFLADFGTDAVIDGVSVRCIIGEKIVTREESPDNWNRMSALPQRQGVEGTAVESFEITFKKSDLSGFVPTQSLTLDGVRYMVGGFRDDAAFVNVHLSRRVS